MQKVFLISTTQYGDLQIIADPDSDGLGRPLKHQNEDENDAEKAGTNSTSSSTSSSTSVSAATPAATPTLTDHFIATTTENATANMQVNGFNTGDSSTFLVIGGVAPGVTMGHSIHWQPHAAGASLYAYRLNR